MDSKAKDIMFGAVAEEKSPAKRLNLILLIIGICSLSIVVSVLFSKSNGATDNQIGELNKQIAGLTAQIRDFKDEIVVWRTENRELRGKVDSLITKAITEKTETNIKLQVIIDRQNQQKEALRK